MELFSTVIFNDTKDLLFSEVPEKILEQLKDKIDHKEKNFDIMWNNKNIYIEKLKNKNFVIYKLYKENKALEDSQTYQLFLTAHEQSYDGVIITDEIGNVVYLNKHYSDTLNVNKKDAIGKHIKEIIPETKIPETLKSGTPEFAVPWKMKGENLIISRIPLFKDNKLIGAIGFIMFRNSLELEKLLEKNYSLEKQVEYYKSAAEQTLYAKYTFNDIITASPKLENIIDECKKIAKTSSNIIITGESGTGKELFAHSIHSESNRKAQPFIRVNCGAIPHELFESELFGYVEGAFTGAIKGGKPGKFEAAHKGTIFLDEIGEMPLNMQVKLLRVIQEREIERVGSHKPIPIDVRVIAATNKNLLDLIKQGIFREDFYYRLNVFQIELPPLRERKEDIPYIIRNIITKLEKDYGKRKIYVDSNSMDIFKNSRWSGNIRELRNVMERIVGVLDGNMIKNENIPNYLLELSDRKMINPEMTFKKEEDLNYKKRIQELERELILKALKLTHGKKTDAAKKLQIARSLLYKKMKELEIIEEHLFS